MCVKNSTSEWVDDEIFEAIRNRDKLFKEEAANSSLAQDLLFNSIQHDGIVLERYELPFSVLQCLSLVCCISVQVVGCICSSRINLYLLSTSASLIDRW